MVVLAMYRGKGKIANSLIRWRTSSKYSHCEFIVDDMWYSSTVKEKGVARRNRKLELDYFESDWDFYVLPWLPASWILDHYKKTKDRPYGWIDLAQSQLLGRATGDNRGDFCSEWMAAAAKLPNPQEYSPRKLMEVLLWHTTHLGEYHGLYTPKNP